VLLWFGLPVLLMSYVGQPVHPFYQLLGLPAGYALVGWAVKSVESRPAVRAVLLALLGGFGRLMAVNSSRFAEETLAAPAAHDLGALPLATGMQLGRDIVEHLPPEGVVYADVDEWTLNSLAGTTFPVSRDTRAPAFSILPSKGGVYVVGHVEAPARWRPPPFTTQHSATLLPGGGSLTLDVYPPGMMERILPAVPLERASEEKLSLLGYALADDTLTSYWRVENLSAETQSWYFQPFVQLSSGGERVTIQGETVPGTEWRQGDVHIHRMTVPLDARDIQIGQYDVLAQRNMIFLPDFTPLVNLSEGVIDGQ
jgi:hypothetical protein